MKRIASSVLLVVLGSMSAFAQGAGSAPAGSSAGPIVGWSLAAIGVIAILVVIARRLSTGQAWKLEVPVAIVGILLLNIGAWRLVANRIDELDKDKIGLQNQLTATKRTVAEQQDMIGQARHQIGQWQARDQEWQKLKEDWLAYANNLKQRLDAITIARAERAKTPVTTTKSTKAATTGKTATKKRP
jgi:hypothetical protein